MFTPNIGDDEPILTCAYFFRWVGNQPPTSQRCCWFQTWRPSWIAMSTYLTFHSVSDFFFACKVQPGAWEKTWSHQARNGDHQWGSGTRMKSTELTHQHMGGFHQKYGFLPPNHPFGNRVFHYKPSILGGQIHPYFWRKHPHQVAFSTWCLRTISCMPRALAGSPLLKALFFWWRRDLLAIKCYTCWQ